MNTSTSRNYIYTGEPSLLLQGASKEQLQAMLAGIAPLHAAYWGTAAALPAFVRPQRGVSWLDGLVRLFLSSSDPVWLKPVWDGLCRWLEPLPVCLSHGDFRPGNMLFRRVNTDMGATRSPVVITDWEAMAVTPFLWDFTYATVLGMATGPRRAVHKDLLSLYLSNLAAALRLRGDAAAADALPSLATCESTITALCIVIFYFGFILEKMGGIGGPQGNSDADCIAWQDRSAAILERTDSEAQVAGVAAALGVGAATVIDMREYIRRWRPGQGAQPQPQRSS